MIITMGVLVVVVMVVVTVVIQAVCDNLRNDASEHKPSFSGWPVSVSELKPGMPPSKRCIRDVPMI
jgi:hypothetical protein